MTALGAEDEHIISIKTADVGGTCTWGESLECSAPGSVIAGSVLSIAAVVVYGALWTRYMWMAWHELNQQLYQRFRVWNMIWQIQVRPARAPTTDCRTFPGVCIYRGSN
jgi:hypothetical protein